MKTRYMGLALSLAAASVLTLTGCGGGGSDTPPAAAKAFDGKFIDDAVGGVTFTCGNVTDITKADGWFGTCPADSTVTFSIGGLVLGSSAATGDGIFFVTDIAGTTRNDISNDLVLKIAVLLQSLDTDGDPSNGITVPAEAAAAIDALPGDNTSIADVSDEFVVAGVNQVVANLQAQYPAMEYVPVAEVEENLADSLEKIDNGSIVPPQAPTGSGGGN